LKKIFIAVRSPVLTIGVFLISLLCAGLLEGIISSLPIDGVSSLLTMLLLRKLGVFLCFVVPPILYMIFMKSLSLHYLGLHREKWFKRMLLGATMSIPIAALWVFDFTLEYRALPTFTSELDLSFPSSLYGVEFPRLTLQQYLLFEVVNQLLVSVGEEVLFRGLLQTSLMESYGHIRGYSIVVAVFTVLHLSSGYPLFPVLMDALIGGAMLGLLYYKTSSLITPIVTHYTANLLERVLTASLRFG